MIPYVLERRVANVEELMERFDYTREQLTRDLNTVFVCGLPGYGPGDLMEAYIDEDDVIIDAADYFTNAPRLSPTEALGLLAAGMTVIGMGEASAAIESAVAKLAEVAVPDAQSALTVDLLDESRHVSKLKEAVARQQVVLVTYRSLAKEETTHRQIEPWAVFATLGRWYVMGHCRLAGDERTFRVDRIRELAVLDEAFEPPRRVPEPVVGYTASADDVVCEIDLRPAARWVLEYYPVEVVNEGSRGTRIRFSASDAELPARLLLRLGENARLVQGSEVGTRVRELGESLLERYS